MSELYEPSRDHAVYDNSRWLRPIEGSIFPATGAPEYAAPEPDLKLAAHEIRLFYDCACGEMHVVIDPSNLVEARRLIIKFCAHVVVVNESYRAWVGVYS